MWVKTIILETILTVWDCFHCSFLIMTYVYMYNLYWTYNPKRHFLRSNSFCLLYMCCLIERATVWISWVVFVLRAAVWSPKDGRPKNVWIAEEMVERSKNVFSALLLMSFVHLPGAKFLALLLNRINLKLLSLLLAKISNSKEMEEEI